MALNTGLFWPKNSLIKRPGKVIFQFYPAIPAGKQTETLIKDLEMIIETGSNALNAESRAQYAYLPKQGEKV
jgi:1-acyl-sn-glycerol-3-phosphate acyltransferase